MPHSNQKLIKEQYRLLLIISPILNCGGQQLPKQQFNSRTASITIGGRAETELLSAWFGTIALPQPAEIRLCAFPSSHSWKF